MISGLGLSTSHMFGPATARQRPRFRFLATAFLASIASGAVVSPAQAADQPHLTTVTTVRKNADGHPAKMLQFGVYRTEADAWVAWKAVVRRQPDMVADLVPRVSLQKPEIPDSGFVLRAAPLPDLDPNFVCRRIVGGGGSCLVVDIAEQPTAATPATTPEDNDHNGVVTYSPDQSREMQEIERQAARLSRIAAIVPGNEARVDIGALKASRWNLCSLTFDDGPHPTVTPRILDILRVEGVRATFFPIGNVAIRHPRIIQRIVQEGHEVGNHSLTHPNMRTLTTEAQRAQIAETNRILAESGADPVLFRPPAGRWNSDTLAAVDQEKMSPALWNVDTRDWFTRDAGKIMAQLEATGTIGSVVLMHTTYNATAEALPRAIGLLRTRGCRFVTLSEWITSLNSLATPRIAQR
ncbi:MULTISPECIES: polysaccharide deacetylase family protein [Azospirillum]|jgi:peptidoglycan/xylan/chitin deacetylase (PgdA/CDA1 family)|uniref:Chitooligosaccharide deacetylase n=2 Tax=Azospirillum brasilense TaxID=192 RepID=A0ABU4PD14_AZOBR|nr:MULTISPECIES: polysaccharide deacetylase family protein [Azospirillum]MDW7554212.1 polysaccharide deacetylase family protein [Azospirillum brasilense]MDW7594429.1 polysaccharide deacetylase family protein [Azospirillum brasilense]MDW7630063.1 polysaccharide deacetylase family protein [Azospirillum brasilense]MDX5955520.1 polysaccharide deacetylase family protein [Azospirillum brasilense]TVZ57505.1 peptidoglycan/xylan/chitin deacetylase (PgdA/CDA1 family) [Azospirillum brasilense]